MTILFQPQPDGELSTSDEEMLRVAGRALDTAADALATVGEGKVRPGTQAPTVLGSRLGSMEGQARRMAEELAALRRRPQGDG
ncbi:hypothetical protein ACFOVU_11410 [Nocardiopsis sediminis]|uniref:YbaB/EbfC family DNA-binding protein n=1 Tax=Nocardiopsis sediminis TaxID=1778267 RepID=A0ABV8FL14_9ACTN